MNRKDDASASTFMTEHLKDHENETVLFVFASGILKKNDRLKVEGNLSMYLHNQNATLLNNQITKFDPVHVKYLSPI